MKKELPSIFASKIEKTMSNNEKVSVTKKEDRTSKPEKKKSIDKTVNQKIKEIFSSTTYVYKVEVVITTKEKTVTKKIIGKNNQYLITMDNELIPISEIIDIHLK